MLTEVSQEEIIHCNESVDGLALDSRSIKAEGAGDTHANVREIICSDIKNAGDCDKIGLYKYYGRQCGAEEVTEMFRDAFFNYQLSRTRNHLIQPGFFVSQYNMNEIDQIPYIDELFTVVDNLYVLVSRTEGLNGEIHYEKFLTWDRLRYQFVTHFDI